MKIYRRWKEDKQMLFYPLISVGGDTNRQEENLVWASHLVV